MTGVLDEVVPLPARWGAEPRHAVAVLVDRCVATLPLHADVVGLRLQVAPGHIIECHVPPYETDFSLQLLQPARAR